MFLKLARKLPEGELKDSLRDLRNRYWAFCAGFNFSETPEGSYSYKFKSEPLKDIELFFPKISKTYLYEVPRVLKGYFSDFKAEKEDVIIDAGAFPGDFSTIAAKKFGSKVFALEPDPVNRSYLESMIHANNIGQQVDILPYALSNINGHANFVLNYQGSKIVESGDLKKDDKISRVETVTLDHLIESLGIQGKRIFVKMDIEGAELDAIEGASKAIEYKTHFIIAAYHQVGGERTAERLKAFFDGKGYNTRITFPRHHLTLIADPCLS